MISSYSPRFTSWLFLLITLFVPWVDAQADINGFGNTGGGFTLNAGATINLGTATLTNGGTNEGRSVFYNTPQSINNGFTASFTYQESSSLIAAGAGIAFVIQDDSRGTQAVGQSGTLLGYGGSGTAAISPSSAVEFNLLNAAGVGTSTTNYATNGALTGTTYNTSFAANLGSGDSINVTIHYDGSTLTEKLIDTTTHVSSPTYSYAAGNLSTLLGSNTAYVGFTGGSGSVGVSQTISDFSYVAVPESPIWGLVTGGGLLFLGFVRLYRLKLAGL